MSYHAVDEAFRRALPEYRSLLLCEAEHRVLRVRWMMGYRSRQLSKQMLYLPAMGLSAILLCGCTGDRIVAHAEAWPEASMLFRRDPRWVDGDGAYSVPLGGDRVLWRFGDSFIARGDKRQADDSVFIRNSVAIQTGLDPTRAFVAFYWSNEGGGPRSFLPEAENGDFFWPGHGAVIDGVLVLFYGRLSSKDTALEAGIEPWTAVLVDNPGDAPSDCAALVRAGYG